MPDRAFVRHVLLACCALLLSAASALAYPAAPYHTFYGSVRNEWGDPINLSGATVQIESTNGVGVRVEVKASLDPGVNYQMQVPMDSATSPDMYIPTALQRGQPYILKVRIGTTTYVPIEMTLGSRAIGAPAGSTRLDLTLGEDSDGDGLPDAWERAIIAMLGGDLGSITPDGDADGDGIRNRDEYLAGTYAFDPTDGFELAVVGVNGGNTVLEFLAIRGRTYTIVASPDLREWSPTSFTVPGAAIAGVQENYYSADVRYVRIEVPIQPGARRFFRARVE